MLQSIREAVLKLVNQLPANPTYIVDNVVHYCVANMPGGVPRTSTMALNKATLPLLVVIDQGYKNAFGKQKLHGWIKRLQGFVTCKGVSEAFDLKHSSLRIY